MDASKQVELYKRLHEEAKVRAETRLFDFFVQAWRTMEARFPLYPNWHLGLMAEHLEAVYEGQIEKLVINIPTRYLKTKMCCIAFPAWVWQKDPKKKFITWSYAKDIATGISWERRQLIESKWYQTYWSDRVKMADDQNQKTRYANQAKGSMFATSTGASMTGEGCDIMVIDDPVNPKEASNDIMRQNCNEFWSGTASSRFDDKKKKSCVLVMQRLHEKDLTGYFLENYPETVVHLKVPNEAPEDRIYSYPKTNRVKHYREGEILQPQREDTKELEFALRELGSYNYAAQRQQEPVPRGGGIIKESWFKYWRDPLPDRMSQPTISVDCAFKDLEDSDYVVFQAWASQGPRHYLLKQLRAQMSFLKTKDSLEHWLTHLFPNYKECLIEDKANGPAIINVLKQDFARIMPISPKDSKVARLTACEPDIEAGDVFLPDPDLNPWVREVLIPEVIAFPKAANDDQVDAMTQYLNRQKTELVGSLSDLMDDEAPGRSGTIVGSLSSL